jgi:hypothetical protein
MHTLTYIHAYMHTYVCIRIYIHTYIHINVEGGFRREGEGGQLYLVLLQRSPGIMTYGAFDTPPPTPGADVCWRMLTNADVKRHRYSASYPRCWRMLTYADVCWRMRAYAGVWRHRYSAFYLQLYIRLFTYIWLVNLRFRAQTSNSRRDMLYVYVLYIFI